MYYKKCSTWRDINADTRAYALCKVLEFAGSALTARELNTRIVGHPCCLVSTAATITRLLERGFLTDAGPIDCPVTSRSVRTVQLTPNLEGVSQ